MPYDVVLAGFEGDWWDAANIYREWVLHEAVWTRAGNLTTRAADRAYPQWLLQAPFWSQIWSHAGNITTDGAMQEDNIQLAAALGTPIGTHWYGWETQDFDTHYPVYTPKPNFAAATAAMQSANPPVHVVPTPENVSYIYPCSWVYL